ncbi:MAG TPA: DUF4149 domain-containing protein [Blastocatellia bacterium]|jgi:hypothetical protein
MAVSTTHTEALKQAPEAGYTAGQQLIAFAEALLVSAWLGSMIFFSFAVAPGAFAALPTRELAGKMVTSAISKVELMGLIIGPLLILIQLSAWRGRRLPSGAKSLRLILLCVMLAMAALSRYWVSAKMVSLRLAMGGLIDDVPATDPLRVEFNDLHRFSVWFMGTAMLAGLAVLFLTVRSWLRR